MQHLTRWCLGLAPGLPSPTSKVSLLRQWMSGVRMAEGWLAGGRRALRAMRGKEGVGTPGSVRENPRDAQGREGGKRNLTEAQSFLNASHPPSLEA